MSDKLKIIQKMDQEKEDNEKVEEEEWYKLFAENNNVTTFDHNIRVDKEMHIVGKQTEEDIINDHSSEDGLEEKNHAHNKIKI